MKFGRKRSSPEPEPVDISHRLSILDLRASVRATPVAATPAATATASVLAGSSVAAEEPSPPDDEVSAAAREDVVPLRDLSVSTPPATQPDSMALPNPVTYEMAAFELPHLSPPVPASDTADTAPRDQPVTEQGSSEPDWSGAPEVSQPSAWSGGSAPTWSNHQVARIEDAEQHVTAWVQPASRDDTLRETPHEQHEEHQPEAPHEHVEEHEPEAPHEHVEEHEDEQMPEPPHEPEGSDRREPEHGATGESHDDVPAPWVDDSHVGAVDLTDPAPQIDLTEQVEHDPVYAAVQEAAHRERPDDDSVIRWHW